MQRILISMAALASFGLLTAGPASAAEDPPHAAANAAESGVTETSSGFCRTSSNANCSGWVWTHARECWRYVSGSEERIFVYFNDAGPMSSTTPNYAEVDTGDSRHRQFIAACASYNWIGLFWTSGSTFSNVRLWSN